MEKAEPRYRYDVYPQAKPNPKPHIAACQNKNCPCFGTKNKSKKRAFVAGLFTNLGICALLLGYTLIGSFIFLAIEGGYDHIMPQMTLATTSSAVSRRKQNSAVQSGNFTANFDKINVDLRARTVENIWDITVSLNILYRDNWTRLAAMEIVKFQDELVKQIVDEVHRQQVKREQFVGPNAGQAKIQDVTFSKAEEFEWTFAKAFLYSLTILTTIGYGSITPKTNLGKIVTMGYATLGIPLTLIYLSSVGSVLSYIARRVFSRALCCCLCSNCGYCCYDEKRMAEKERKMKRKRQQQEIQQQASLQEPFYVRSNSTYSSNNLSTPNDPVKEADALSCLDSESRTSMHGLSILAPILLCLMMMLGYVTFGAFALYRLENWNILDGFYFCFMSLTTIGFGDLLPGIKAFKDSDTTIWFCSIYIMSGMALTAMCFNVLHEEIIHRLRHQEISMQKFNSITNFAEDAETFGPS